ncbi:MAG: chromosomal replication initiator protein DnaA [Saprospiraceae bacterium]
MGITNECQVVWDRCLHTIKKSVAPQTYRTWFEPIKPVLLDNQSITIEVPNKFFYEWLEEHHVQLLKRCIRQELGDAGRLIYRIVDQNQAAPAASVKNTSAAASDSDNAPAPGVFDANAIKNPFIIPGIKRLKIEPQLNPNYTFDNFIEGDCNRLARNAGIAISQKPGKTAFNPLVIFGDVGLGKTHLAQAIGNAIVNSASDQVVLYVTAEKFTNQIIQAIRNNAVNDFVAFYQMVDVLIIDDIQFLAGKQKMQEIFFHLFNQLHQASKQIILTSDKAPKDLTDIEDRLISRFKWGLTADLQAPDLETRMAILHARMANEGFQVSMDVLEFICYNIKDNVRELEGIMVSLLAQATLLRRDIDVNLVKEVIRNHINTSTREISMEQIMQTVAAHYQISADKLKQGTRKQNIVIARQTAMYLCKTLTPQSLKAIGDAFGGRDHSTVIYSVQSVHNMMDVNPAYREVVEKLEKELRMSVNK